MRYRLAIFDLDGTILDTLEDLTESLNHALNRCGCPSREKEEVRRFLGNGIRSLVKKGAPAGATQELTEEIYRVFMPYYQAHCAEKTGPYPGVMRMLERLRRAGVLCAVVSNKADPAVKKLCEQYFPKCFQLVVGEKPEVSKKPAPDMVVQVMEVLNISREQTVYIGDSEVDYQTAKNVGVACIGVSWGFRDREVLLALDGDAPVDSPEEVAERILCAT